MPLHEKKKIAGAFVLTTLAIVSSISVHAAARSSKSEREVEYRRSLFTVVSVNFGPLGAMAEGDMPFNAAEAQKRAERLAFLAPMKGEIGAKRSMPCNDEPSLTIRCVELLAATCNMKTPRASLWIGQCAI